jgi:membrane protein implicated in regulation of membrane protease activity
MATYWNWMLILGGAALILLEVMLGGFAGFDLVLIGTAFLLGGALGLLFGDVYLGMAVAGVLCAVYILVGRRWVRKRLGTKAGGVRSNADAVIGETALVVARLAPHMAGRVRVRHEEWRAQLAEGVSTPIEEGAEVTVTAVDGVTLLVR